MPTEAEHAALLQPLSYALLSLCLVPLVVIVLLLSAAILMMALPVVPFFIYRHRQDELERIKNLPGCFYHTKTTRDNVDARIMEWESETELYQQFNPLFRHLGVTNDELWEMGRSQATLHHE